MSDNNYNKQRATTNSSKHQQTANNNTQQTTNNTQQVTTNDKDERIAETRGLETSRSMCKKKH